MDSGLRCVDDHFGAVKKVTYGEVVEDEKFGTESDASVTQSVKRECKRVQNEGNCFVLETDDGAAILTFDAWARCVQVRKWRRWVSLRVSGYAENFLP